MMNPYLIRQHPRTYLHNSQNFTPINNGEFIYDKQIEEIPAHSEFNIIESKFKILKSKQIGSCRWQDAVHFDDLEKIPKLLDYKIHKIKIFYGVAFSSKPPSINGIEVTYKHLLRDEYIKTGENKGDKELTGYQEIELNTGQFITNVHLRNGFIVDSVSFALNDKGYITIGGQRGNYKDFELLNRAVVGFYGTYGTNLYSLGLYSISDEEYHKNLLLKKRFSYLAIRHRLHDKHEQLQTIIQSLDKKQDNKNSIAEIAFAKLCLLSKYVFADVITYVKN
jgi:hypothetical protein